MPNKRPRGRPPLSGKRKFDGPQFPPHLPFNGAPPIIPPRISSSFQHLAGTLAPPAAGGSASAPGHPGAPIPPAGHPPVSAHPASAEIKPSVAKESSEGGAAANSNSSKNPKAHLVTQKIISRLMTEAPVSVSELMKLIPETPKELIQSILDILQVLGMVVQLRSKEVTATGPPTVFYALVGFSQGDQAVDVKRLLEVRDAKIANALATRERIQRLQVKLSFASTFNLINVHFHAIC